MEHAMSHYCLVCRRELYQQRSCLACDLPAIDLDASLPERRHQIRTIAVLLARRSELELRATYPPPILRAPEPEPPSPLKQMWDAVREGLSELLTNLRGMWRLMRLSLSR